MPRNYKQEWQTEKARQKKKGGVLEAKLERQRARRKLDKDGVDRTGKDIAHRKALSKGGSNKTVGWNFDAGVGRQTDSVSHPQAMLALIAARHLETPRSGTADHA